MATVRRTLEVARLCFDEIPGGGDLVFAEIRTPTDRIFPGSLALSTILDRAARCGLTPGEAARLSCEEIVGELLQVW